MIKKYKIGDALKVDVQDEQVKEAEYNASFFDGITAYSMVNQKGDVLAVLGFRVFDEKGECFALMGKNIGNRMIEFVRFANKKIKVEMKKQKVKKVFMTVKDGFIEAKRLAFMLGFSEVAKLPLFFDEKDYLLYVRKE